MSSKVPKVQEKAYEEVFEKCISMLNKRHENPEEWVNFMLESDALLYKKQPVLHNFIEAMIDGHSDKFEGKLDVNQFFLYVAIVFKSLYNQEEIDNIGDLFEEDN